MSKLAINGGTKTINDKLPHFKWPIISQDMINAVADYMKTEPAIWRLMPLWDDIDF